MKEFIDNTSECFTSVNVNSYIKEKLCIDLPLHHIRQSLKYDHNLCYKMGRNRPIKLNQEKLVLLTQLFWIKLVKELENIRILINLDEWTISN